MDLLIHFFLYSIYAVLLYGSLFIRPDPLPLRHIMFIILVSGTIFGALTEFLQHILPVQRDASWIDLCADIAGVITGLVIGKKVLQQRKR